jgi:hypothetical protein
MKTTKATKTSPKAKKANRGTLSAGRNQMAKCRSCGKRTHSSIDGMHGIELCRDCLEDSNKREPSSRQPQQPRAASWAAVSIIRAP